MKTQKILIMGDKEFPAKEILEAMYNEAVKTVKREERRHQMKSVIMTTKDGQPFKYPGKMPGRNDLCPCQSGRKFKHCCLEKLNAPVREMLIKANTKEETK